MLRFERRKVTLSLISLVLLAAGAAGYWGRRESAWAQGGTRLARSEYRTIVRAAVAQANKENSIFRIGKKTKMHIAVVDRSGGLLALDSMPDAWEGSIDIAIAKARTAALFSSNENALSSRDIGLLSQAHFKGGNGPDEAGPLWGIWHTNQFPLTGLTGQRNGLVTFPGGLPLYKNNVLVGGIGVSGDGVDQDEAVAIGGSRAGQVAATEGQAIGFEAPAGLRSTAAISLLPYTKAKPAP